MSDAQERLDKALEEFADATREVRECDAQDAQEARARIERASSTLISAFVKARAEEVVEITDGPAPRAPQATILLRDSSTSKRVRYTRWYHKGGCLCVELAGVRDGDGNPVILEVPHEQYTYALRPHLPHVGMEERG